jgi:hypothetical protein
MNVGAAIRDADRPPSGGDVPPQGVNHPTRVSRRRRWGGPLVEAALAFAALASLCVVVLSVAPQAAEPEDGP